MLIQLSPAKYEVQVATRCNAGLVSTVSPLVNYEIGIVPKDSTADEIEDLLSYYNEDEETPEPAKYEEAEEEEGLDDLNTPFKIIIDTDALPDSLKANLPPGGSLPTLPQNPTIEQLKDAIKARKTTCAAVIAGYKCGNHDAASPPSGDDYQPQPGDELAMNSIKIEVVEIDAAGNGLGIAHIKGFNNAKLGVEFKGIKVKEGGCIYAGQAITNSVDLALLNQKQRAALAQAYAAYNKALDKIEENAEGVAETINGLADLLAKAKAFAKNYKGGKAEAAKAKAYEENIKKAQNALLKNKDVPDSLKTALAANQATAQAAWDFYKTGQPCTVSGNSGGGDAFFILPLADCGGFTANIDAEALAVEKASGSLACNCSPIISDCSPIENILSQIKNGNNSNQTKINVAKVDNKESLSNETDWVSALNGIDIEGKCFKIGLNFKFNGNKIDLNPKKYKETTNGFDLIDDKGVTLLSINLLGETGQAKYLKQAILKKYLGFEEKEEILTIKIYASGKIVKYVPKKIQEEYKKQYISGAGKSYPLQYIYYDKNGTSRNLGTYTYFLIKNPKSDIRWSRNDVVDLVDIRTIRQEGYKIHLDPSQNESQRYYLNPCALGSIIGASLEVGFTDIDFRGFSKIDGTSGTSKTHYNGYYGDFGYFCKDQSRHSLSLKKEQNHTANGKSYYGWSEMDEERQNKFNDALHRFGWDGFWSWKYNGKYLNYSSTLKNHDHHLHTKYYYKCINDKCTEYEK